MGLLKRILGFLKGDNHDHSDDDARRNVGGESSSDRADKEEAQFLRPGKGFSVQIPVTVDRAATTAAHGPVLVHCTLGDGGVQGLQWCAKRLRVDEDGDVADEFLDEVLPGALRVEDQRQVTKFAIKCSTRPVKVSNQMMAAGGIIQQSVEYQGRLQWI